MAAKLTPNEESAVIQFRIPTKLKKQVMKLAKESGDGDVSHWIRRRIHEEWKAAEARGEKYAR